MADRQQEAEPAQVPDEDEQAVALSRLRAAIDWFGSDTYDRALDQLRRERLASEGNPLLGRQLTRPAGR